ncbi:hypothetical protein EMCRGX_G027619 [Ephydatia muelleri]
MASVLPFVRGVDFSRNDFPNGGFSTKVTDMSNLRWLRLKWSNLSQLPKEIDQFKKLEALNISHNQLKDIHGGDVSSINTLRVFNASHNHLSDESIPQNLFCGKELVTVDVSYNNLVKISENLAQGKNIIALSLSHNKIVAIPGTVFTNLSGVQFIDLSDNELQNLPPQIRRLEHLQHLNLANNPLQHFTFKMLEKLTSLTYLNLSNTGRDFSNTPHLDKLIHLTDVDMSCNNLSRIPEPLYLLENIQRVKMSHNCIRELSSLIDTWTKLVTLDLSSNLLTSLHPNICKCNKLRRLFLSDNKLTFEGIPPGIGKLAELEHFVVARNQLECVPEGLVRCYKLKTIILCSNRLVTLPEGIHYLKLEKLDIRDNPNLVMPPKPAEQVKGAGDEWYNIDFDPEILQKGVVTQTVQVIKNAYARQKERRLKSRGDEEAAMKVLKGLVEVADQRHQRDVQSAASGVDELDTGGPDQYSHVKPKRWDATLKRHQLDYADIFPEDTGSMMGLTVWQIENFYPVQVEDDFHGHFYLGDCYIILKTQWNQVSELDWEIYYWIGRDSTVDKKACAAVHAVNLRNMLNARSKTHREEYGEESEEFLEIFNNTINYIEGGSQSGFFPVQKEDYTIKLYRVQGGKKPFLEPVETASSSLDLGHVFVLDAGTELYLWYGNKSTLMERSKGQLIAEKIRKIERKSQTTILIFRPGEEPEEFWTILGGEPSTPVPCVYPGKNFVLKLPKLYKVGLGAGYLELPQVELPQGKLLYKSVLKSNEVYVLDFHTDIFVWIGRKSSRLVRAASLHLAEELREMIERPSHVIVSRVLEGAEPQVFKIRFEDWEDVLRVDFTRTPEMLEKRDKEMKKNPGEPLEKKAAKVDLSALFMPQQPKLASGEANEIIHGYNDNLKSMRCCVIEGKKFNILDNREKGHFYSGECYFFLCRYSVLAEKGDEKDKSEKEEEEEGDEQDDDEEVSTETIVYFWQGRDASNMGWLHFSLGIRKQLEKAMDVQIEVIHIKQQQEDYKFLSHFGGKFIIHKGKRNSPDDNKPALYQIRSNDTRLCRRVIQVEATPKSLNSAFCHILKVPFDNSSSGIVYIWIGEKTTQEEAIHAEQMGRTMFESNYSNVVIKEGTEPENFFWVALGGKADYEHDAIYMEKKRLFRCSNEKGYFAVSEKYADFGQDDLSQDDVMILDTGVEVFIWFGANASEIEKKLGLKSAQTYVKHVNSEDDGPKRKLKIAKREAEPWEFTRCFHGWVSR